MLKNTEKISHTRKSCVRQGEKRVKEERKKETAVGKGGAKNWKGNFDFAMFNRGQ